MNRTLRVTFVACLVLSGALALAATPVTVYPNPIAFGTVPLNSTSSQLYIFVSNSSATAVTVSAMTISGTNSGDFTFYSSPCIGTISAGQSCEMYMTFTPSAMANLAANLVITETGLTTAITIPLTGTGGNPIPNITSLSPPTVYVDSPSTTITINGTGFLASSVASLQSYPNTTSLPTTFVSATQIKAKVPDTVLSSQGQISLYVTNPAPGGGAGSSGTLQVIAPEPTVNNLSPTSIVAGTASEAILINGQNFGSGAKVQWNGTSIPTTYLNSGQLQIQPTTTELADAGIVQLTVTNPSPGTISPSTSFDLTYPITVTVLDLPANDIVWDPFAQRIYASLPSSYGANGNSIAVINPSTGAVAGYHFAGSEPTQLALDSTSKFLYVGLNGDGSIQRLNLPGFTDDIVIGLGNNSDGPNLAAAIAVSPTNSDLIAVAVSDNSCCSASAGPLQFFTNATKLADSVTSPEASQISFASGTTLYGYYSDTVSEVTVSSTGGTLTQQWNNLVTGNTFQYSGGLIFGGSGEEFNPVTGLLQGTFDVGSTCCSAAQVLPDSAIDRAFALAQTPFFSSFGITSYNLSQFTPLAVASLAEFGSNPNSTSDLIQWGPNGLAFIMTSGCCGTPTTQIVLVQSPTLLLTDPQAVKPAPVAHSSIPATVTHGSGNTLLSVRGSGFVPGSVVNWNNKAFSAKYVSEHEMTVYVPKAAIAAPGTAAVVVKNPTPGGGKSNALSVTIK